MKRGKYPGPQRVDEKVPVLPREVRRKGPGALW